MNTRVTGDTKERIFSKKKYLVKRPLWIATVSLKSGQLRIRLNAVNITFAADF